MRKNGCVTVGDTEMYYVAFGDGKRNLVVLPGLSDGLTTVKGKAWLIVNCLCMKGLVINCWRKECSGYTRGEKMRRCEVLAPCRA